jgi:hypothetical protein
MDRDPQPVAQPAVANGSGDKPAPSNATIDYDLDEDDEYPIALNAVERARLDVDRVRLFAGHTRFHIGLCAAIAGGIVALAHDDLHWWKLLPFFLVCVAGLAGAVIAANLVRFSSLSTFRSREVGPKLFGLAKLTDKLKMKGGKWELLQQNVFWAAIVLFVLMVTAGAYDKVEAQAAPARTGAKAARSASPAKSTASANAPATRAAVEPEASPKASAPVEDPGDVNPAPSTAPAAKASAKPRKPRPEPRKTARAKPEPRTAAQPK